MNGFDMNNPDSCDCTMGYSCEWHARQQRERSEAEHAAYRVRGVNPNATIEGLEEIIFAVSCCSAISGDQKEAIMRVLFPVVSR